MEAPFNNAGGGNIIVPPFVQKQFLLMKIGGWVRPFSKQLIANQLRGIT